MEIKNKIQYEVNEDGSLSYFDGKTTLKLERPRRRSFDVQAVDLEVTYRTEMNAVGKNETAIGKPNPKFIRGSTVLRYGNSISVVGDKNSTNRLNLEIGILDIGVCEEYARGNDFSDQEKLTTEPLDSYSKFRKLHNRYSDATLMLWNDEWTLSLLISEDVMYQLARDIEQKNISAIFFALDLWGIYADSYSENNFELDMFYKTTI